MGRVTENHVQAAHRDLRSQLCNYSRLHYICQPVRTFGTEFWFDDFAAAATIVKEDAEDPLEAQSLPASGFSM
jgi:hypothetical protein